MAIDLHLSPKQKRPAGEPCCEPVVYPDVERAEAERLAAVAKALGDPIRLQLIDVLRKHAGKVCVCELTPLFDAGQVWIPTPHITWVDATHFDLWLGSGQVVGNTFIHQVERWRWAE